MRFKVKQFPYYIKDVFPALLWRNELFDPVGEEDYTNLVISDFIDNGDYRNAMTIANRKHDVVAIQVYDRRLAELPRVGLIKVRDAETGEELFIDTSSSKVQNAQREWWRNQKAKVEDTLKRSRVDYVSIRTDGDYVKALMNLFAQRG